MEVKKSDSRGEGVNSGDNTKNNDISRYSSTGQKVNQLFLRMCDFYETFQDETEVEQETFRSFAKQIPKSPEKHHITASSGSTNAKNSQVMADSNLIFKSQSEQTQQFPCESKNAFDIEENKKGLQKERELNRSSETHHNLSNKETTEVNDENNQTMIVGTEAENDYGTSHQVLATQGQDRSFIGSEQSSAFYSQTMPCTTQYDGLEGGQAKQYHSGYLSLDNIRPKKTILGQISELSSKFLNGTKEMINTKIKNRYRCRCELGIAATGTCGVAMEWLQKYYKLKDLKDMKQQYEKLLVEAKENALYNKQIDMDVTRTFTKENLFAVKQPLHESLKNVLYAFSFFEPQIGYLQGMNSIAAVMVFHAEDYVAFWLTCMAFELLEMREIYLPGFPGMKKHVNVIEFLMWKHIPYLHEIFIDNGIKVQDVCQSWILSLFGNLLPLTNMTELIDGMLNLGWGFFYRLAIAFILIHEEAIIRAEDPDDVPALLSSASYQMRDSEELVFQRTLNEQQQPGHTAGGNTESGEMQVTTDTITWSQLIQSARNINLNDAVVSEILEKYEIN